MRAYDARQKLARGRPQMLGLILVAMTACSTGNASRYRSLDDEWQRSAKTAPATIDAGDALFEGARVLERRDLVEAVLARNPTVRAARYAWRAALARHPQVTSLEDPILGAGVAPRSIGSSDVDDAPKFDLSQKLPFPGKLRLKGEAALAEAEAASHDYEAVRLRLAAMASLLFDDYNLATRSLEINDEHVALLEEFRHIASARYEVGEASQQDPIQAEVQLAHALHREVVLATAQKVTAEQINALLRRPPKAPLPPPPLRIAVPEGEPGPADALIEEALEAKPELAAAAARIGAEESRVDLAWREYFPDFAVVGSYNKLWQAEDLQPFVGIQLNVPLQRGRRRGAVDEAEARLEVARSQRLAIEDEVRLAVHSGVDRLAEARHIARLYRDRLLPAARDHVAAARAGFETGRNSFLALIDAERNLLNVELGYEESLADLGRRRAELDRARGRIAGSGW
jgi:outer membrane protein TolC